MSQKNINSNRDNIFGNVIALILVIILAFIVVLTLNGYVDVKDTATVGFVSYIVGTITGLISTGIISYYYKRHLNFSEKEEQLKKENYESD